MVICARWNALREGGRGWACRPRRAVVSCYEAGRDGFWIHRALTALGVANRVVDSASIEVNRRARRAKTDRLDALKLVRMLVRVCCGERRVWSEVRVPTVADEGRAPGQSRAHGLDAGADAAGESDARLAGDVGRRLPARGAAAGGRRCAIGRARRLPAEVQARLARADARLAGLAAQIAELEAQQQAAVTAAAPASARPAAGAAQGRGDDERLGAAR